jgi:hypothetical protein
MKESLAEEAKYILELEKVCLTCGFNYNNRVASLVSDCLPNACRWLLKKMDIIEPVYNAKMYLVIDEEKPVNEQIRDRQRYLYQFYSNNCKKDGEEPLSYDLWLHDKALDDNWKVIPDDKVNSKEG